MITAIQFLCWILVEFAIVFYHVVLILRLLGPDAFMRNTPNELSEKITLLVASCAFTSTLVGFCFLKLSTL